MAILKNWQRPRLRREDEKGESRKASWLELFFDLFFVVVIAQVAHELSGGITPTTYFLFVVQLFPVLLLWVGHVYYCDRFESDGIDHQIATFLMMLCVTGMAVFAHHGLNENYRAYILFFAAGRFVTTALWIRATIHDRDIFGAVKAPIVIPAAIGIGCIAISAYSDGYMRYALLGVGLLADLLGPLIKKAHIERLPPISIEKTHERFGLFTIIVLGEVLVGIVSGLGVHDQTSAYDFYRATIALAMGFTLWWVYFNSVPHRTWKQSPRTVILWSYFHLPLFIGISGLGPAFSEGLANENGTMPANLRILLALSLATFLFSVGLIEMLIEETEDESRRNLFDPLFKMVAALAVLMVVFTSVSGAVLFWYLLPVMLAPNICSHLIRRKKVHS